MPRAAALLAAALIVAAAPAGAQSDPSVDGEVVRLRALAERAYALNLADDHDAEPALRDVIAGRRALGWGETEATRATVRSAALTFAEQTA